MRMVKMTRSPRPVALALAMTAALAAQALAVDTDPPTVMDLRADGVLLTDAVLDFAPASIVVTFSEDIDPATVSVDTFRLVRSGGDGTFGDGNEVEVTYTSITATAGNVVTVDLAGVVFVDDYQVAVSGGDGPTAGLVAHWKFDETSDTTAYDSSGSGNDGTLVNGPVWQPTGGKIGGALAFDGSNDYVDCGNGASLNFTDAVTMSAWAKLDAIQSGDRAIVEKDSQWRFGIQPSSNRVMNLVQTDGINGWTGLNNEPFSFATQVWYHFAFTWDGSALRHYVYGQQIGSDKTVTGKIVVAGNNVRIGYLVYDSNYFDGLIDDVRIYNRALSAAEVAALAGPPAVTDLSANPLDGEFTGSFPPSGDGTAGGDFVCMFTITAPAVLATSPADGATDVPVGATLEAVFSRAMDPTSTEGAFVVTGGVTGTKSWAGNSLLLTPDQPLEYEHYYTVTITTDAKDATGIAVADTYTFAFTTAPEGGGGDDGPCGAAGETSPVGWLVTVGLAALLLSRRLGKAASA